MTLPATDGFWEKLQALLTYDATSPLIFSSGLFLFLFAGFLLIYSAFGGLRWRIVYVVLFSLYFYYKSSGICFLLLIFAAASDFLIARGSTMPNGAGRNGARGAERGGEPRNAGLLQSTRTS